MSVNLKINGKSYGGWEDIRIDRSIETISGGFTLTVSEKWPGQNVERDINPGDSCTVLIDGDLVITGYVDDVDPRLDGESHSLVITGRDRSGQLVDCSAINSPGQWSGLKLDRIIQELVSPFGVAVSIETKNIGEPFKKFAIQQGETVHEAIARACKLRAVLCISDRQGGIKITSAGTAPAATALVQSSPSVKGNILRAENNSSIKERFSKIIVKGQTQGDDNTNASLNSGAKGIAIDSGVKLYRPLLVMAEGQANTKQCQERAEWERRTRAGKADRATITVAGWRQGNGALWDINSQTLVRAPWLKLNKTMLICGVSYSLDGNEGSLTELTLVNPDAFLLIRDPEPRA